MVRGCVSDHPEQHIPPQVSAGAAPLREETPRKAIHNGLSDAQPQNALVQVSDEIVLILRVSVKLRYERCPLKTDLNLAEAIGHVS